jgi:hypothetical protein
MKETKLYPEHGFTSSKFFHQAVEKIDAALSLISNNKGGLVARHRNIASPLFKLTETGSASGSQVQIGSAMPGKYSVEHIHEQYIMVQRLRTQLMDSNNMIFSTSSARDLSELIKSMNSLINLFIRTEEMMNHAEEESKLMEAVKAALETLPAEARQTFFAKLESLEQRVNH